MATVETDIRDCRQFIGGEWVDASSGETFEDLDPFRGDVVARVPAGTRADA
jgi:acyl-CoA reductase-like NAD-dependent aldehyde dehydrogenase